MAFKMYKGDAECVADMEQLTVMTNAGWSRIKAAPAPEKEVPKVDEPAVDATTDVTAADVATNEPEKEAPKKVTPKKRRVTKK